MASLHYLTEEEARFVVARIAQLAFPGSPEFQLRGQDGLNSLLGSLAQPHWPYYRALPEKAAILHYGLNKNHPFNDGNKRFALTAMELFLMMNRSALLATADTLHEFAVGVASNTMTRDESVSFVKDRCVRFHWPKEKVQRHVDRLSSEARADAVEALNSVSKVRSGVYEFLDEVLD